MKTILSLTTLVGVSLFLAAFGSAGAKAQTLYVMQFTGTFTLPFEAQWGGRTLPAGEYILNYGILGPEGNYAVEAVGTAKGSPHALVFVALPQDAVPTTKDSLICIREGNGLVIWRLDLPTIGKSIIFGMPHGARLAAHHRDGNTNFQLAEAHMLIQRVLIVAATDGASMSRAARSD